MYLASHKMDIEKGADPDQTPQNVASDQRLHSLLTGNYVRNRIKMIQDTWQPLNDKLARLTDKDCIFLRKYGLIVSVSMQNVFKGAFLIVLSKKISNDQELIQSDPISCSKPKGK